MFLCDKFQVPTKVKTKEDLNDSEVETKLKQFMNKTDLVSSAIEFQCRKYQEGDLVILKRTDKVRIEVGVIKAFLVRKSQVFVIVRRCILDANYLRFYESSSRQ